MPFLKRRAGWESTLVREGPAPQPFGEMTPPDGISEVTYLSGDLALKAWYASPKTTADRKVPGLVYFHSGFAFGPDDFEFVRPFLEAGFAVMTPMLRGENGNPGHFELFGREFNDGCNAVGWLADQPSVDSSRIYAFGHSVGGGVSALLSLAGESIPLRLSGSCGGLYPPEIFATGFAEICPFDPQDASECELRVLLGNERDMKTPHIAYLGLDDPLYRHADPAGETKLEIVNLLGDHFSSATLARDHFLRRVRDDASSVQLTAPSLPVVVPEPDIWSAVPDPVVEPVEFEVPPENVEVLLSENRECRFPSPTGRFATFGDYPSQFDLVDLYSLEVVARCRPGVNPNKAFAFDPQSRLVACISDTGRGSRPNTPLTHSKTAYLLIKSAETGDLIYRGRPIIDGEERSFPALNWVLDFVAEGRLISTVAPVEDPEKRHHGYEGIYSMEVNELRNPIRLEVEASQWGRHQFSPGRRYVLTMLPLGRLEVVDLVTGRKVGSVALPKIFNKEGGEESYASIRSNGFSRDGRSFAAQIATKVDKTFVDYLLCWEFTTGRLTQCLKLDYRKVPVDRLAGRRNLFFLEENRGYVINYGTTAISADDGKVIWIDRTQGFWTFPRQVLAGDYVTIQRPTNVVRGKSYEECPRLLTFQKVTENRTASDR
ncbi:alpha/beta hydrolase family protein [Stratiformator vulcanicus]|uniref:alpha/beta hydrolase family protein n=1 Tax=Stratiformator vulcanicus TaxID=2527980 RepID=UPI00287802EF|nr:CocE/NonD family hydrolase [Stratiformator vulcanicus]